MPRVPEAELERLKREVSLARLCERYGVELHPHGKDLLGRCPFQEKSGQLKLLYAKRSSMTSFSAGLLRGLPIRGS